MAKAAGHKISSRENGVGLGLAGCVSFSEKVETQAPSPSGPDSGEGVPSPPSAPGRSTQMNIIVSKGNESA